MSGPFYPKMSRIKRVQGGTSPIIPFHLTNLVITPMGPKGPGPRAHGPIWAQGRARPWAQAQNLPGPGPALAHSKFWAWAQGRARPWAQMGPWALGVAKLK